MPEVGSAGQKRLKGARVLLVGTGGLGAPLSLYLAAAGVGRIGLVDFDRVDLSNIHRQVIYSTSDVGREKLDAARDRLTALNPEIEIDLHDGRLTSANALEIVRGYDVVADGSDNFPTRYLVNDACVLSGKPDVYASVFRFEGQVTVFDTSAKGPCYRCLFPDPPAPGLVASCAEAGVLGVLPGIMGCFQALEVLKWILKTGESLIGRLVLFDALAMRVREISLKADPRCPICGDSPTIRELVDYEAFCGVSPSLPAASAGVPSITVESLKERISRSDPIAIIDVREPYEFEIAHIEGALLIPLGEIPSRIGEIAGDRETIVYCHHGIRSAEAVATLLEAGRTGVHNLEGGIDAWAERCDPGMTRY
jgi:sulfur-carrier protein adenylyltransferase/sulfurtransferase